MNVKEIKELAKIAREYGLESIEASSEDGTIKIKAQSGEPVLREKPKVKNDVKPPIVKESSLEFDDVIELPSPMVGVFYAASAPDREPFVKVGDKVKKGDVLCIIESMKLMNEVVAERDCSIVDICVENNQVVEFGQPLFKVFD